MRKRRKKRRKKCKKKKRKCRRIRWKMRKIVGNSVKNEWGRRYSRRGGGKRTQKLNSVEEKLGDKYQ